VLELLGYRYRFILVIGAHCQQIMDEFLQTPRQCQILHVLSWAGPPGTSTAAGMINKRRDAFEGRLRDLQTGVVVATFADSDMQDAGPLDLTRLTWYGPAKGIMDQWAKQFVQIANRKPGEMITDPTAFTLRPF
jgi:hypothetical protein